MKFRLVNAQEQQFYRRLDHTGTGVYDDAYYQLTDSSSSVVAHLDATGNIRQWMSYDAYGAMKVLLPGDFDGDGRVTPADID